MLQEIEIASYPDSQDDSLSELFQAVREHARVAPASSIDERLDALA